jgi:predicted metal-dependent peptidase
MIKDVIRISKELIYSQPFYGSVLLSLNKEIDNKIKTAGVGLAGIMYNLKINETFWQSLSDKHKQGLLVHELGHIVNFHLTEYKHLKDHDTANIAMDIYINQYIDEEYLPPGACTYQKFDVPEKLSTNEYYDLLMKSKSKSMKNALSAMGKGDPTCQDKNGDTLDLPDHAWEDIEKASEAIQKMVGKNVEHILRNTVEQLKKSNPGSIPGGVEALLDELANIEPPKFNWKGYVRTFIGTSTKTWSNKTRRKKSKRFAGMPGLKEYYFSHILVAIDTSYSVDEYDLREFYNELVHIHKTGHDIDILLCDTKIQKQFRFNPRKPFNIDGRGGTNFQPVIDHYNKNLRKYSCLIYLSDGEAGAPSNARGKILWVHGTKHAINESLPGRKVKLN